jgi:hypothetical protein
MGFTKQGKPTLATISSVLMASPLFNNKMLRFFIPYGFKTDNKSRLLNVNAAGNNRRMFAEYAIIRNTLASIRLLRSSVNGIENTVESDFVPLTVKKIIFIDENSASLAST